MDSNRQKSRNLTKTVPLISFFKYDFPSKNTDNQYHRPRSATLDSIHGTTTKEDEHAPAYRFPPEPMDSRISELATVTNNDKLFPPSNKTETVKSSTIQRLSLVSEPDNVQLQELDGLSYGLRVRLREGLHDTSRNSFANQVDQLSRRYSVSNPGLSSLISTDAQWAVEISQPLSALYAILVVIISACLAFSSQLTSNVDSMYCRYFDSILLFIGIIFLLAAFGCLYRKRSSSASSPASQKRLPLPFRIKPSCSGQSSNSSTTDYFRHSNSELTHTSDHILKGHGVTDPATVSDLDSASFYLKMGALAFGIGSMIYACLELGVFVENTSCFNTIMGLNPVLFMVFVVLQLYFVFLNSQLTLRKYRTVGRFGLMHMVATNLCIWIRTLIDETLHAFGKIREKSEQMIFLDANMTEMEMPTSGPEHVSIVQDSKQGKGGYNSLCVDDESVMKKMMEEASVFLYPCIIEYSMISAGIVYIMWTLIEQHPKSHSSQQQHTLKRRSRKTSYAVDCHQAAKGLFVGIIIVVLTIVSLILYFIFLDKPEFAHMAVLQAQITEISLYGIGMLAVVYCFVKMTRNLRRSPNHSISSMLDETLLKISMMGVYAYAVISILGGFAEDSITGKLSVVAASLCLVQSTGQTIFIFDASQRVLATSSTKNKTKSDMAADTNKPAREAVTLLLIVNFAMWATNVFCTLRQESSPSQTEFFGTHEWMIILHVTVPLVIFYRFHSTACLFEIWKRAYKVKRRRSSNGKVFLLTDYMTTA